MALPETRSRSGKWDRLGRGRGGGRVNGGFCFAGPRTQLRGYLETKGCRFILKGFFKVEFLERNSRKVDCTHWLLRESLEHEYLDICFNEALS